MNNESMNTVVETFFVNEVTDLIHDGVQLQKWNDRVAELGLTGQTEIVTSEKSPIPFLWMNTALIATFETLCPSKVTIDKFSKSPIPVELLDAVALCKKEEYFYLIEVWFNEKEKDPVIVGYKKVRGNSDWEMKYYAEKYLIGRWADVKSSLDQLIKRAKQFFISSNKVDLQLSIKAKQRELEDIEQNAEVKFGGALPATDLPF